MLANFDPQAFADRHWLQEPLLIRNALPRWQNPCNPDQLAGLALEEFIESRIVTHSPNSSNAIWQLQHGPFSESELQNLSASQWTLLVQSVDQYLPEVAALLSHFDFLPNWQLDDVMVSYASTGGGVGPHFDRYNVFLVQGLGRREWKIGQHCQDGGGNTVEGELSLIDNFEEAASYTLEPGDILYLPPYIAHWGTALEDDCMTYSVGLRSPSYGQMLDALCGDVLDSLNEDQRFEERLCIDKMEQPGLIPTSTLERLSNELAKRLLDQQVLNSWFGRWITLSEQASETRFDIDTALSKDRLEEITEQLQRGAVVYRQGGSRFAYYEPRTTTLNSDNTQTIDVFIQGEHFLCHELAGEAIKALQSLCNQTQLHGSELLPLVQCKSGRDILLYCFVSEQLTFEPC